MQTPDQVQLHKEIQAMLSPKLRDSVVFEQGNHTEHYAIWVGDIFHVWFPKHNNDAVITCYPISASNNRHLHLDDYVGIKEFALALRECFERMSTRRILKSYPHIQANQLSEMFI